MKFSQVEEKTQLRGKVGDDRCGGDGSGGDDDGQ